MVAVTITWYLWRQRDEQVRELKQTMQG